MALAAGAQAPAFTLFDTERKPRSLSEFLAAGPVVLAFYPGAFTGVCTKEVCALRDAMADMSVLKAQVVGISVDSPFANKAFADQNRLGFPLLSDHTREVALTYAGIYEGFAGVTGYTAAKRAVYVIDRSGKVRYAWITDAPGVEPNYAEINAELAKL